MGGYSSYVATSCGMLQSTLMRFVKGFFLEIFPLFVSVGLVFGTFSWFTPHSVCVCRFNTVYCNINKNQQTPAQ